MQHRLDETTFQEQLEELKARYRAYREQGGQGIWLDWLTAKALADDALTDFYNEYHARFIFGRTDRIPGMTRRDWARVVRNGRPVVL